MNGGAGTSDERADHLARRRRDQVFGDVLPESTSDDREQGGGHDPQTTGEAGRTDAWLRENVPPHHG